MRTLLILLGLSVLALPTPDKGRCHELYGERYNALSLLPLIAVARLGRGALAVWLGLILFVAGTLVSLLINQAWPVALRVYYGVGIFSQSFTLGVVIGYPLGNA